VPRPFPSAPSPPLSEPVAEDEDAVRELVCRILERSGYHVLRARDGQDALRVAQGHPGPIDLLVTDIVMPRMSGSRLAEALGTSRPETRVLYMSGYADPEQYSAPSHPSAASGFIEKPFAPDALVQKVRELIDGRPA